MQARYLNALAASARCAAGEFTLAGRKLFPLSLTHAAILDSLELPLWRDGIAASNAEFLIVARVCSVPGAAGFSALSLDQSAIAADMEAFDLGADPVTWDEYVGACYASRPCVPVQRDQFAATQRHGPWEEFVVDFILGNSHGYTRVQLIEEMPAGLVLWVFEAVRERITGKCRILTDEELEESRRVKTKEEREQEASDEKTAAQIIIHAEPSRRLELLKQLSAGTLPKNWREKCRGIR